MRPILRQYQNEAIDGLRAKIRNGSRKIVLICPTGGGKTLVASEMVLSAVNKGSRCLFIAHRRELIDQTVDKLSSFGVHTGVIMAGDSRNDDFLPVQVASVQTLVRRLDRKPEAQLVIVDECHHTLSATYKKIVAAYPNAVIIGLTATPWRTDRLGLADIYDTFVVARTPAQLMQSGYLVEYDAFAYDSPDLHNVKTTAGEFNQTQLAIACNTKVLVGHIVQEYLEHARNRRAIMFPVNVAHSMRLVDEFVAAGIVAEHVDAKTPTKQRESAMTRFRSGDLMVLSSVGVLTEGFDAPTAEVCILARPTKSLSLFLQMVGRVLRPSPETGKQRALIHDHAGNLLRHGLVEDEREYTLTHTPNTVVALHTCPSCFAVFNRTKQGRCPSCNELIAVPEEREGHARTTGKVVDGVRLSKEQIQRLRDHRDTVGIDRKLTDQQLALAARATREQKIAEYLRLKSVQARKGFKDGFVAHQFRGVFGHWPRFKDEEITGKQAAATPFFSLEKRA